MKNDEESRRRWPLVLMLLVAAVLAFRVLPSTPPPPATPIVPEIEAIVTPAEVVPPTPTPPEVVTAMVAPPKTRLNAGFCAAPGEDASFRVVHTLEGFLQAKVASRPAVEGHDDFAQLVRSVMKRPDETEKVFAAVTAYARWHHDEAAAHVLLAVAATNLGKTDVAIAALREAFRLIPTDPGIGFALGNLLRQTPFLDEAIRGISAYLAVEPDAVAIERIKARLEVERGIEREYRRDERDGVTLSWPAGTISDAEAASLLTDVSRDLDLAAALLGAPRRTLLSVVVYPGQEEMLAVSCVNTWAGALFDGRLRLVARGKEASTVERPVVLHETLHAELNSYTQNAPMWFHEGVAQYLAHHGTAGIERQWKLMVANRSYIPLSSLDGTFQAFEADDDASLAYAESLGLVLLLVDLRGDVGIAEAARLFRTHASTPAVLAEVVGHPIDGDDLLTFLARRLARP